MPCSDSSGLFWILRQELKQFPSAGSPDQPLPVPGDPGATASRSSPCPHVAPALFAQLSSGPGGCAASCAPRAAAPASLGVGAGARS